MIRTSDRLEALAALAVLVVALFAIPVATQAGTMVHDAGVRTADEQAHTRHSVNAVVVEGSPSMPADFDSPALVSAQWREGTRLRTEHVVSPPTVKTGDPIKIWLDDTGTVVAAPLTPEDARLSAAGTLVTVWLAMVACSALVAYAVRLGLDRSRARAWEHELNLLAHNDDGWANRNT